MKRRLLAIFALALSVSSATSYKANVEGWEIAYFPSDAVAPKSCIMGGSFRDGTRLSVLVSTEYEWTLALSNQAWNLRKDATTKVSLYVDGLFVTGATAANFDQKITLVPLTGAGPFRALQTGHRLDIQTPSGNLNFQLTGTGKAMYAVLDCVRTLVPKPTTVARADFQALSQAETAVLLTNLFNSAGMTDYRLDPPKKDTTSIRFTLKDGTVGFLKAARGLGTREADDYAAVVIGGLSELCKGEFLSGKQSVPSVDGSILRKVITSCRTSDGMTALETTIIRRPSGFLMELTQEVSASGPPDNGDRNRAALVNAALRVGDGR